MASKAKVDATGLRHAPAGDDSVHAALDDTDLAILAILQREGRVPNNELADRVHLTPAPCLRRVRRLEDLGVITGYASHLEPNAVGRGLCVFVELTLDKQTRDVVDQLEPAIAALPEVLECHLITGDADYLLKIAVGDLDEYQAFLINTLIRVPGIADVKTVISMKEVKRAGALALNRPGTARRRTSDGEPR